MTATAYADTEADYTQGARTRSGAVRAAGGGAGEAGQRPLLQRRRYSLVDAAYAPFLQRYFFLDRIKTLGYIEKFPRLKAWAEALLERPSTHSFPADEFEAMYRDNVRRRQKWVSQFIEPAQVAAE